MIEKINDWIKENDIVLFMKGNKKSPKCGFSNFIVKILRENGVNDFKDIDVLQDDNLRDQIKKYSNWPTIPQLYIKN